MLLTVGDNNTGIAPADDLKLIRVHYDGCTRIHPNAQQPRMYGKNLSEIAFAVADAAAVDATHADWRSRGYPIAQKPTAMDFGHTFVALDPDGHRLRVFAPAAA